MNIKTTFRKIKLPLLLAAVLGSFVILTPPVANAQSITDLCKGKVRVEACQDGVKDKCDSKEGDEEKDCQSKRAADFKDAEAVLFTPKNESSNGQCGNEKSGNAVKTRIGFGCLGNEGPDNMGAIEDLSYSLDRFLSAGVGIVIVFFIILAGIQYSTSEGNPEQTQQAKNKIRDAIIGLIIYIFAFALIQYLVPGGVFASMVVAPDTALSIMRGII